MSAMSLLVDRGQWHCAKRTWDGELSLSLQESGICLDELLRLRNPSNQHYSVSRGLDDPLAPAPKPSQENMVEIEGGNVEWFFCGIHCPMSIFPPSSADLVCICTHINIAN
jgi:hypothetical protein